MDGYELNKYLGAGAGALGVFMAILILTEKGYHGHHHDEPTRFYVSEVEEEAEPVEEEKIDYGPLLVAATVEDGAALFDRRCSSCHINAKGADHGQGPALYGVMGRQIAAAEGFRYSSALEGKTDLVWDWDNMGGFLTRPAKWAPGTKMSFAGFRDPEDVAAVMLYLNEYHDAPLALPDEEQALAE
ncbi:MAG: c-type cytochrome [Pseudomonadota bacterium]